MDAKTDDIDLQKDTLTGDVRDAILDRFRHNQLSWGMMREDQQRAFAHDVDGFARNLVRQVVDIVAAEDRPVIRAKLGEVKGKKDVGGDIEAKIVLPGTSEYRHALFDARGLSVMLIVADAEQFGDERAPAHVEADQGDIVGRK